MNSQIKKNNKEEEATVELLLKILAQVLEFFSELLHEKEKQSTQLAGCHLIPNWLQPEFSCTNGKPFKLLLTG